MLAIDKLLEDIYFQKEYLKLYLKENEEIFEFRYESNAAIFYQIGLKRPINKIGEKSINEDYFDLETVYGYGGILCNSTDETFLKEALKKYEEKCFEEKIIAEFARIHPFNENLEFFKEYYSFLSLDRKTVVVNTSLTSEERKKLYSSSTRNILKHCAKNLSFEESKDVNTFFDLYKKTMERNQAEDFYYFNKSYFEKLLEIENCYLFVVKSGEDVVSASYFMFSKTFGHYHLSANDFDFKHLNGNYFILDSIFDFAFEKKIEYFHLGGGRTNQEDDSLLRFKQKFSKQTKDFYIAGKIHNLEKYNEYIQIWKNQNSEDVKYFLKYRL